MNKTYIVVAIVVVLVVAGGVWWYFFRCNAVCEASKKRVMEEPFSQISPESFKEQSAGAMILDVRTPEEYVTGHIKGAALVDISANDFRVRVGQFNHESPYYVYCQSGSRSAKALQIMKEMGFKKAYGLEGGIGAWRKAGFPVE